ncbi:MAG: ferritin-like domain-containing protein [Flavitalea sp.]
MATNENLIEVLNDLIRINNDRVEGYQRAVDEAKDIDVDLKAVFNRMSDESRQYASELTQEVVKMGGEPATGTTTSGKIYRVWMDIKATFSGKSRQAVLENCEFGEDAAQKAYDSALETDADMSTDVRQLITNQKSSLKTSHDVIKKYRDMHKTVNDTVDNIKDSIDRNF